MHFVYLSIVFFVFKVESVKQNVGCPNIKPRELDLVEMDGKWYLAAVATDLNMSGDCAYMVFNHKNTNTTDISISWVANNTASYYNGSVALTVGSNGGDLLLVTYTDTSFSSGVQNIQNSFLTLSKTKRWTETQFIRLDSDIPDEVVYYYKKTETYSVLAVDYEHYAVIFACYEDPNGNSSTYELWKLTRAPHLKRTDATKLDQAVANYSLQNTPFMFFNNSEHSCKINGGYLNQASLILTSATAIALFRRLY